MQFVGRLGNEADVRAHGHQRGADLVQEIERRDVGIVEAHAVQVETGDPVPHGLDQIRAQVPVAKVEAGKHGAVRYRVVHTAGGIAREPLGMGFGQRVVGTGAIERPVKDDAHAARVDVGHQSAQCVGIAQRRINGQEIARGVRIAMIAVARLHRHHPDHAHAQILQVGQFCAHAVEGAGKGMHRQLVDDGVAQPLRAGQRGAAAIQVARCLLRCLAGANEHVAELVDRQAGVVLRVLGNPRIGRIDNPVRAVDDKFVVMAARVRAHRGLPGAAAHARERRRVAHPAVESACHGDALDASAAFESKPDAGGCFLRQQVVPEWSGRSRHIDNILLK